MSYLIIVCASSGFDWFNLAVGIGLQVHFFLGFEALLPANGPGADREQAVPGQSLDDRSQEQETHHVQSDLSKRKCRIVH